MNENGKKHRPVSPAIGVMILLILTIILFIFVSLFLHSVGLLTFPDFIERLFSEDTVDTDPPTGRYSSLYDALIPVLGRDDGEELSVDPEMLTELLFTITPPSVYYQRLDIGVSSDGETFRSQVSEITVNGEKFTVYTRENDVLTKTVLGNQNAVRIYGGDGGIARTFENDGTFSVYTEAGIPDLSHVAALIREYTDGDESDIKNYVLTSSLTDEGSFIKITFEYTEPSVFETYVISLYDNVIWTAESRNADGNVTYRAETLEFSYNIKDEE